MMPLLEVNDLKKYYPAGRGEILKAVDGVSFSIEAGETLGIVGESGCGKSTTGRVLLKLEEPTDGRIFFEGTEITRYTAKQMRPLRRDMQIIFQDPYASLDPRMRVAQIIAEPLITHNLVQGKADCEKRVDELLEAVGLPVDCRKSTRMNFGRTAPAHQHCALFGAAAQAHRMRRAGIRAGCFHTVSHSQPATRITAAVSSCLYLHLPCAQRRQPHVRPGGRDVSRADGGACGQGSDLRCAATPLHKGASFRNPTD